MIEKLQSTIDLVISGAIGSFLSLMFHDDINTWKRKGLVIVSGTTFSVYVAPFTIDFFQIGLHQPTTIGFFCGLFGMSLAAAVIRAINAVDLGDLIKTGIGNIFGGGK